jgi:hypothetical protein
LGAGGWSDDDIHDWEEEAESGPRQVRKKLPKGKIKVSIEGEILAVLSKFAFKELYRKTRRRLDSDYVWAQGGLPADACDKMRYHFPPDEDKIRHIDVWLDNDPTKLPKGTFGTVRLRIDDTSF